MPLSGSTIFQTGRYAIIAVFLPTGFKGGKKCQQIFPKTGAGHIALQFLARDPILL
ncbi:hypothetical protein FRB91_003282 [Serendipita sp. 411]|nr:hypothetical protein FRB91_003282 [Serendipita sp. 411]